MKLKEKVDKAAHLPKKEVAFLKAPTAVSGRLPLHAPEASWLLYCPAHSHKAGVSEKPGVTTGMSLFFSGTSQAPVVAIKVQLF